MDFVTVDALGSVQAVLAELLLAVLLVIVLAVDLLRRESQRRETAFTAAVGMVLILVANLILAPVPEGGLEAQLFLGGMIRHDTTAQIFRSMILLAGAITCLISADAPRIGRRGEYYAIVIAATLGMCLMSATADLIMLLVALETTSISLYILTGFLRGDTKSAESGVKYFLFGAFTSAILLYGLSLLYGLAGQTNLYSLADALAANGLGTGYILLVMVMVLVGFGFKVSAVPFHFWTPDVYEGAPTPITAFISVGSKAASFALLLRFFLAVFPNYQEFWIVVISVLAAITMTLGNVLALVQRNIKRLLAYSSIAQAGYALIGLAAVAADNSLGVSAVVFYMFMYVLTNLAAFTVVILVTRVTGSDAIADMAGLHQRAPRLAFAMFLALLSLGGIPPLAGFAGKLFVFSAAVDAGMVWLAVVGVINALVGLYYYLIVAKVMYVDQPAYADKAIPVSRPYVFSLVITIVGMVLLGTVLTGPWLEWSTSAASGLF